MHQIGHCAIMGDAGEIADIFLWLLLRCSVTSFVSCAMCTAHFMATSCGPTLLASAKSETPHRGTHIYCTPRQLCWYLAKTAIVHANVHRSRRVRVSPHTKNQEE